MSAPDAIQLETLNVTVTARCNWGCPCCYQESCDDELSLDLLERLRDQALPLGLRRVMLSGGEPLMRADIAEVVALFAAAGVQVTLSTNGSLVTPALARALAAAGLDTISLSVQGVDDGSRRDRAPEGDDVEERAAAQLLDAGLRTVANVIVTHTNLRRFDATLERVRRLGISNLNLLRPKPSLTPGWFERVRLTASDLYRLQRLKVWLAGLSELDDVTMDCALCPLLYGAPQAVFEEEGVRGCTAGIDFLNVSAQGALYPCPDLRTPAFLLGNLRADELARVWRDDETLATLRDPGRLEGGCGRCKLAQLCRGCRSLALHDLDDVFGDDLDCPYRDRSAPLRAAKLAPVYGNLVLAARRAGAGRALEPEPMAEAAEVAAYEELTRDHRVYDDAQIAARLAALVPPGREIEVLDVGCGTGRIALRLLDACPGVSVTAVDLSAGMLAQARHNLELELPEAIPRLQLVRADGKRLPFADGSFDLAFCSYTLHHLARPERLAREVARVTRPDGGLLFYDLRRRRGPGLALWVRLFTLGYAPQLRALYRDSLRAALSFKEFTGALAAAGLADLRVERGFFDQAAWRTPGEGYR